MAAYTKTGFGASPVMQTKGGVQPGAFQLPQQQPQTGFQAPQPQAPKSAPNPSIMGLGHSFGSPAQAQTSSNVMAQGLPQIAQPQVSMQPAAASMPTVQPNPPTATVQPAPQKPKYDPYMLAQLAMQSTLSRQGPGLKGGGFLNQTQAGYDRNAMTDKVMADPSAFLGKLKQAMSVPDSIDKWRQAQSILGDDKTGAGYNGGIEIMRNLPASVRDMIMGYDKAAEPEAPPAPTEAPPAATPDPQDIQNQERQKYYDEQAQSWQQQIGNLTAQIQALSGQNNQSLEQAIQPPAAITPTRPYEMARPGELGDFLTGMSDVQARTALATRGVQGEGLGKDSESYFLNMLMRNLIGDDGNMGQLEDLTPIEQQYLQMLGLPTADEQGFLKELKTRGNFNY